MYGSLADSKSGRPLFNKEAWAKANNLLKEILRGYYSDPPGVQMYSKKLNADGSVKKNKYGMEEIECSRGTNRVEAYHKNLVVTFGGWHVGIAMSAVLLAENRHRYNQRCAERRRDGHPMIGHYDTWLIDLLQQLVQKNHHITLYPHWSNASDFKDTDESFDTVALHSSDLHNALENQCNRLDFKKIKLSREQKFLCQAQGVSLPFLPFTTPEEKKVFSKHYSVISKKTEHEATIWWCKHVDGVTIFPKLPVHFRDHLKKWLKSNRTENAVRAAKKGAEKLKEINNILSPLNLSQSMHASDLASASAATASVTALADSRTGSSAPGAAAAATSTIGLQTSSGAQPIFTDEIPRPSAMPQPNEQALHNRPYTIVGGTLIGSNPGAGVPVKVTRGRDKKPRTRKCKTCDDLDMYENDTDHKCAGSGGRGRECDYFDEQNVRRCWRCWKFGEGLDPYTCHSAISGNNRNDCEYFFPPKYGKCKRRRII